MNIPDVIIVEGVPLTVEQRAWLAKGLTNLGGTAATAEYRRRLDKLRRQHTEAERRRNAKDRRIGAAAATHTPEGPQVVAVPPVEAASSGGAASRSSAFTLRDPLPLPADPAERARWKAARALDWQREQEADVQRAKDEAEEQAKQDEVYARAARWGGKR